MGDKVAPFSAAEHFCPSFHGTSRQEPSNGTRPPHIAYDTTNTHEPLTTSITTYDEPHHAAVWYATGRNLTMRPLI